MRPVSWYFNSRPREGGDSGGAEAQRSQPISIHAPAKGATDMLLWIAPFFEFQFTPPRRGRLALIVAVVLAFVFQFTPPRRGRRWRATIHSWRSSNFNSRPREGGDPLPRRLRISETISIHAPAKGATTPAAVEDFGNVFQFTPPRRGRRRTG